MSEAVGFVVFLAVVDIVVVGCVVGVVWAGASGRLTANASMGIRTPATVASHEAWRAGHRAAWPWAVGIAAVAALCIIAALVLSFVGRDVAAWACAFAPVAVALAGLFPISRAAQAGALETLPRR
ncbi:MAG: SdpI family protein [Dermatophilaceae bacterium]